MQEALHESSQEDNQKSQLKWNVETCEAKLSSSLCALLHLLFLAKATFIKLIFIVKFLFKSLRRIWMERNEFIALEIDGENEMITEIKIRS